MQNVLGAQGPHGELTELSVTGAQEVVAAAVVVALKVLTWESLIVATGHGAGSGAGAGSITPTRSSSSTAD